MQAPRALESEAQSRGHAAKPTLPTGTEEEDLEIRCWRWEEKEEEEVEIYGLGSHVIIAVEIIFSGEYCRTGYIYIL